MHPIIEKIIKNRDNLTLLESAVNVMEEEDMDFLELAEIIKNEKTFLDVLKYECKKSGCLKEDRNDGTLNLNDIFRRD